MRRERKRAEGMMLQIDATPFDWLESRGPRMALAAAIDDATSQVVYASFRPTEDQAGYLLMLRAIATTRSGPQLRLLRASAALTATGPTEDSPLLLPPHGQAPVGGRAGGHTGVTQGVGEEGDLRRHLLPARLPALFLVIRGR
jgi:hypothetical protein